MSKEKKSWSITLCEVQNRWGSENDRVGQFVDFQDPEVEYVFRDKVSSQGYLRCDDKYRHVTKR